MQLALGVLRIFLHDLGAGQTLLVAQLDAAQVEYTVLHCRQYPLAAAGGFALVERADDAEREMQSGAAVADLCAGDERRPVVKRRTREATKSAIGALAGKSRKGASAARAMPELTSWQIQRPAGRAAYRSPTQGASCR